MAKGFTVKAKTPKGSVEEKAPPKPEWDYDAIKERMRGKTLYSVYLAVEYRMYF